MAARAPRGRCPDTAAFYFYAEPDPFGLFTITATSGGVSSGPVSVDGFSGARYFGVYTTGAALTSITVSSSVAFAVGEFGIAKCMEGCDGQPVPEPSSLGLLAAGALTLLARRRRKA